MLLFCIEDQVITLVRGHHPSLYKCKHTVFRDLLDCHKFWLNNTPQEKSIHQYGNLVSHIPKKCFFINLEHVVILFTSLIWFHEFLF
jgi:hypothetical protein